MSNPRVPFEMSTERRPLAPLRGKPLMVHVVVNVEHWPFDQAMPRAILPAPHGKAPVPDVPNFAWVEYGLRAGMPRLLDILEDRGLPASAFVNAACIEIYPSLCEAMLRAAWEFVGHSWVQRSLRFEDDEAAVIRRSLAALERFTGKRTRGWLGPGMGESEATPDLLKAAGIEWLSDWYLDDLPCWMRTKHGPMLAMPYTVELNDVPIYAIQNLPSDEMLARLETTLKVLDTELATQPRVLTIALHPHIMGVPHRAYYLARALDVLLAREDTVFVTGSEIADWFVAADGTGGAGLA